MFAHLNSFVQSIGCVATQLKIYSNNLYWENGFVTWPPGQYNYGSLQKAYLSLLLLYVCCQSYERQHSYELWHWSQAAYVQIVAPLPSIRETWKLLYIAKLQFPHT